VCPFLFWALRLGRRAVLGGGRGTPSVLLSLVPVVVLAMIATLALGWLRMPEHKSRPPIPWRRHDADRF
jgi:hypothetical protein